VIYPGSTPVGNATLVVANVLTCNKYSHKAHQTLVLASGFLLRSSNSNPKSGTCGTAHQADALHQACFNRALCTL
jgi:hypothetical protein